MPLQSWTGAASIKPVDASPMPSHPSSGKAPSISTCDSGAPTVQVQLGTNQAASDFCPASSEDSNVYVRHELSQNPSGGEGYPEGGVQQTRRFVSDLSRAQHWLHLRATVADRVRENVGSSRAGLHG